MEKGVTEFIKLAEKQLDDIFQRAAKSVITPTTKRSNSILRWSPVDTGEFVANWEMSVNGMPFDRDRDDDPTRKATASRLKQGLVQVKFGDTIRLTNEDPIGARLEFGYSKQAPQGVMRSTARRWPKAVKSAARAATRRVQKKVYD